MTDKHHFAKELLQYAENAQTTGKPWLLWECRNLEDNPDVDSSVADFIPLDSEPEWKLGWEYRRKATTITIINFIIPKPAQEPLNFGQKYYVMCIHNPYSAKEYIWQDDCEDRDRLRENLIYPERENAVTAAQLVIKAIKKGQ